MFSMLKGVDVILHQKQPTAELDGFGRQVYEESTVTVSNVLIYPAETSDNVSKTNLSGKHIAYELSIPRGDNHTWENAEVEFFGERFRTVGYAKEYIDDLLPLEWNRKIRVERHE